MHKKIRTANEEMKGILEISLFSILWYAVVINNILTRGFTSGMLIFLVAGILMPVQAFRACQKAFYYRKLHEQCMQSSPPVRGRIVNIVREYYNEYENNRRRQISYYFLIIEIINPDTGVPQTIKSEPYSIPIHKYLGSPCVQVYTDSTGWKHVIDGFQLKANRNEPDISLEDSNVYLKDFNKPLPITKIIFLFVFIMIMLQMIGMVK